MDKFMKSKIVSVEEKMVTIEEIYNTRLPGCPIVVIEKLDKQGGRPAMTSNLCE